MYADQEYIVSLRREIHQYPEIGFELPKTISVVKRELKKMGIEYTENYGRSSVVATLCPDKKQFTIGIRADMDALLIEEKTDLPFRSKIPGQMHACGHDAHTAMLLGTAKALKQMEEKLSCRVMLIFQPSEEGIQSGAAELVRGGLMDEIDIIIGLHIENWLESGTVGVCAGSSMASSRSFRLDFNGKTAHATMPQTGADALAAAVRTYNNIQYMLAREINPFSKHVCSIGKLCGGTGQNIVADHAFMLGTIRTYDMDLDEFLMDEIDIIIGLHIENWLESGTVGVCAGSSMASSRSFRLDFNGKTAHATMPQTGADALAAAVRTYNNIQYMLAREINPFSKHVCSIGKLCGGTGQNIVADHAFMLGTIRTYDMDLDEFLINRIEQIAKNTASETGVEAVLETSLKAYVVYNNPYLSKLVLESAEKVAKNIQKMPEKLSSEDFSQYLTKKPGVFIRLGTRNEEKGCTTLPHNNDFMLDEDALSVGSDACVQFVLDNMNGVDMDKVAASDERRKE